VNAARNILLAGLRCRAPVSGNESSHLRVSVEPATFTQAGADNPEVNGIEILH
jgi:hypothetical protein